LLKPSSVNTTASKQIRGIAMTLTAMLLFGLMDAASKYLSVRYSTPQVLWLRYLFTIPLLLAVLPPRKFIGSMRSHRPGLQCCRALLLATEIGLVIWAFGRLPLADVHAVLALTPLVVTGLSVPLLGEQVGPRQWAAVAAGFLGALIVLRPGFGVMQPSTLVVLVAVLLYALYQVLTRLVGRGDTAETSLLWQIVIGAVVLSGIAPFQWRPPALEHWPLFVLAAALGGAGHFLLIRALQLAPVAVTQPFTYTLLLWAVVIGYLSFGDVPDRWTLVGAAVVIAAGSYSALQERRSRSPTLSEGGS
jgi:drug/metabolite transporter (DMT)-like permease